MSKLSGCSTGFERKTSYHGHSQGYATVLREPFLQQDMRDRIVRDRGKDSPFCFAAVSFVVGGGVCVGFLSRVPWIFEKIP